MAKVKNFEEAEGLHKKHMKWIKVTLICMLVVAVLFGATWLTIYYLNEDKLRFEPINKFNAEINALYDLDQYKIDPQKANPQHKIFDIMIVLDNDENTLKNFQTIVNLNETNFNVYNVVMPVFANVKISWFVEKEVQELVDNYAKTRMNIISSQNSLFNVIYSGSFNNAFNPALPEANYDMVEARNIVYNSLIPAYIAETKAFFELNCKMQEIMIQKKVPIQASYLEELLWITKQAQIMLLNNYFSRITSLDIIPDDIKNVPDEIITVSNTMLNYSTYLKTCSKNYALFVGKTRTSNVATALNALTTDFTNLEIALANKNPVEDKAAIEQAYSDFYKAFTPSFTAQILTEYFS